MEENRYKRNKPFFFIFMFSLIIGLSLLLLSIFIMPNILWGWAYNVPDFIYVWREGIRAHYDIAEHRAGFIVLSMFLFPALLMLMVAYLSGTKIENEIQGISSAKSEHDPIISEDIKETTQFSLKLLSIITAVLALIFLLQWLIFGPS